LSDACSLDSESTKTKGEQGKSIQLCESSEPFDFIMSTRSNFS
jgi:hypothetical protein